MSEPDESNWRDEAEAVMADIREHVRFVSVSTGLPMSAKRIYINVTTFEGNRLCIEMTGFGFRIVGKDHDRRNDGDGQRTFETPYSLLDSVSPGYRDSFGKALQAKLMKLEDGTESS